jgi:hypothetical protein
VVGVLLLAVLTMVPFRSGGPAPTHGGQAGRTAVQSPAAAVGIAAALVVGVAVAWLAAATLMTRSPVPPPAPAVLSALAVVTLALVVLDLVLDAHGLVNGAWLAIALAVAFAACRVVPSARSRHPAGDRGSP